jgi:hypothetical protein
MDSFIFLLSKKETPKFKRENGFFPRRNWQQIGRWQPTDGLVCGRAHGPLGPNQTILFLKKKSSFSGLSRI